MSKRQENNKRFKRLCSRCNQPHRNLITTYCNDCKSPKKLRIVPIKRTIPSCETCGKLVRGASKHCYDCNHKHTCECGSVYTNHNKHTHLRTNKHQDYINESRKIEVI